MMRENPPKWTFCICLIKKKKKKKGSFSFSSSSDDDTSDDTSNQLIMSFLFFPQKVAYIGLLELLCSDCYMRGEWMVCYKHIAACVLLLLSVGKCCYVVEGCVYLRGDLEKKN